MCDIKLCTMLDTFKICREKITWLIAVVGTIYRMRNCEIFNRFSLVAVFEWNQCTTHLRTAKTLYWWRRRVLHCRLNRNIKGCLLNWNHVVVNKASVIMWDPRKNLLLMHLHYWKHCLVIRHNRSKPLHSCLLKMMVACPAWL